MESSSLEAYRALAEELSRLRQAGEVSLEVESSYAERLDELWWRLSEAEQQAYEESQA